MYVGQLSTYLNDDRLAFILCPGLFRPTVRRLDVVPGLAISQDVPASHPVFPALMEAKKKEAMAG